MTNVLIANNGGIISTQDLADALSRLHRQLNRNPSEVLEQLIYFHNSVKDPGARADIYAAFLKLIPRVREVDADTARDIVLFMLRHQTPPSPFHAKKIVEHAVALSFKDDGTPVPERSPFSDFLAHRKILDYLSVYAINEPNERDFVKDVLRKLASTLYIGEPCKNFPIASIFSYALRVDTTGAFACELADKILAGKPERFEVFAISLENGWPLNGSDADEKACKAGKQVLKDHLIGTGLGMLEARAHPAVTWRTVSNICRISGHSGIFNKGLATRDLYVSGQIATTSPYLVTNRYMMAASGQEVLPRASNLDSQKWGRWLRLTFRRNPWRKDAHAARAHFDRVKANNDPFSTAETVAIAVGYKGPIRKPGAARVQDPTATPPAPAPAS